MRKLIKRWLGITELERTTEALASFYRGLNRRVARIHNRPQRYDEIQRAQSRRRYGKQKPQYDKGATTEESSPE